MIRKITLFFSMLLMVSLIAIAANSTLNRAQLMLSKASTEQEYRKARKVFEQAKRDLGYTRADDRAINAGIATCDRNIARLSAPAPTLTVEGQSSEAYVTAIAGGGKLSLNIKTNQSQVKIENLPSWLKQSSVTTSRITLKVDANNSDSKRSGWFVVSAGSRKVTVYVSQAKVVVGQVDTESFKIYDLTFINSNSNTTKDGFVSSELYYLYGILKFSSNKAVTKHLDIRIVDTSTGTVIGNSSSPTGYTFSYDAEFYQTEGNSLTIDGYGSANGNSYTSGSYDYEVYCEGKLLYSKRFTVQSSNLASKRSFEILDAQAFNSDDEGKMIGDGALYADELRYVKLELSYASDWAKDDVQLDVRIHNPAGQYKTSPNSPAGFTLSSKVKLERTSYGTVMITGWGNSKKSTYDPGEYKWAIYYKGNCIYEKTFTILGNSRSYGNGASSNSSSLFSSVQFGAISESKETTGLGEQLIASKIRTLGVALTSSLASLSGHDFKVIIRDADGKLLEDSNSPAGYTAKLSDDNTTFETGLMGIILFGGEDAPTFHRGKHTFELYDGENMVYSAEFTVE